MKANYVPALYRFLRQLGKNNNREWFAEHRGEYDELRALWLDDIQRLINAMGASDSRLAHLTPKGSAFRIYRDTRFSLDKSPFKTYFSASFSPTGRNVHGAGYYLQMGPGDADAGLFGGIWQPDSAMLRKLRTAIVDNIEEFESIITDPQMTALYPGWCGEQLKTVPKGYDRNHPLAHLLRLKDIGRFHPCNEAFFADRSWPEKAAEMFMLLRPLNDFIDYSLNE